MATKLIKCDCRTGDKVTLFLIPKELYGPIPIVVNASFQDKKYGHGTRLANKCQPDGVRNPYCCTLCNKKHD